MPTIALPSIPPTVDLKLGLTDEAWPGIVKMALHFVLGFAGDVPIDEQLRAIVLQNQAPPIGPPNSSGRTCWASMFEYAWRPTRTMSADRLTPQHMWPATMKHSPPIIFSSIRSRRSERSRRTRSARFFVVWHDPKLIRLLENCAPIASKSDPANDPFQN